MTKFLIKLFIKDKDKVQNIEVREKYGMLSSITGGYNSECVIISI